MLKKVVSFSIIFVVVATAGLRIGIFLKNNQVKKANIPTKKEKYHRKKHFGTWKDINGDQFNARHSLLREKSIAKDTIVEKRRRKKVVVQGIWIERFGNEILYNPQKATIDHLVSLKEAWVSGACHWSAAKRRLFYNLPLKDQLVIMSRKTNTKKSDRDPTHWMPDDPNFTESFIDAWFSIKKHWNLSVDEKEWKILNKFIDKKLLKSLKKTHSPASGCQ